MLITTRLVALILVVVPLRIANVGDKAKMETIGKQELAKD